MFVICSDFDYNINAGIKVSAFNIVLLSNEVKEVKAKGLEVPKLLLSTIQTKFKRGLYYGFIERA